jgi:hypothetical protein
MVNNGFIAENKNGDVQLYDSRGEFIAEISDDFDDLEYVDGFGILQRDGNSYYILDDDSPKNQIKCFEFNIQIIIWQEKENNYLFFMRLR